MPAVTSKRQLVVARRVWNTETRFPLPFSLLSTAREGSF